MQKETYVIAFALAVGISGAAATHAFASPNSRASQSPPTLLAATRGAEAPEGGIAGVTGVTQNFESGFNVGSGCMQQGWAGACVAGPPPAGFLITQHAPPDPRFGSFSAIFQATGNPAGFVVAVVSPLDATPETGRVDFDLRTSASVGFSVETGPCATPPSCLINTRLNFNINGNIEVLTLTPGNCTTGTFTDTGADWLPNVAFRIGMEVNGAGVLNVFKDNVLIHTGTDISVACAPAGPQGIGRVVVSADNTTALNTVLLDNIGTAGGGLCPANIVNSGTSANRVDVDDLLAVISSWGPCPAPPAPCPANVVTAGTSATRVDVDDMLFIITSWGPCP